MELSLKPTSAKVKDYYNALNQFGQLNISHETAVRQAFERSGTTNEPNREGDNEYILRLIGQVITLSLETVKIINALPDVALPKANKAESAGATQ